jgi:ABC-type sugar transport system ATPase subunit
MIGREVEDRKNNRQRDLEDKKVLIELKDFKTKLMKEPVSLAVRESEIVGITGIVGAGKSELAYSIFGKVPAEAGEMLLYGKNVKLRSAVDSKKYKIAFIPEDRKSEGLFLNEPVSDNKVISNLQLIENKFRLLNGRKKNRISREICEKLQVVPLNISMPAKNLSGGNQQKVVIAKWLIGDPDIIIMDEPTRGIDVGAKSEIYSLIRDLGSRGKGIIVMSSEYKELIDLCDRILVLRKGAVVGELLAGEATSEKLLSLSLGG